MIDNLQITRTSPNPTGNGTNIYFTFAYPTSGDTINGYVNLSNTEFLSAMKVGTDDDPNTGLYKAVMQSICKDVTPYLSGSSSTTASEVSSESSSAASSIETDSAKEA